MLVVYYSQDSGSVLQLFQILLFYSFVFQVDKTFVSYLSLGREKAYCVEHVTETV